MEEQIAQLLAATQDSAETPRKQAELQLLSLYPAPGFPLALASVASHDSVPINIRQAALLYLRQFVPAAWSPDFDEYKGQVLVNDEDKTRLRQTLLELALNSDERKLKKAASYVVSKIGSADFPEDWPQLLPTVLRVIDEGNDDQVTGALKVLADLIDESFNEDQFFGVAQDLVNKVFAVATADARKPILRALAISVFRACLDILEMVMEEHKDEVKLFADEALSHWIPYFVQIMKSPLPAPPTDDQENTNSPIAEAYRGMVAIKLQVVKVLMRIRSVFPSNLTPQSPALFSATWEELSSLQKPYHDMFIEDQRQSRLEDDNGLPYTLDWLVLEELDFMQACLRAAPVRKELDGQLKSANGAENTWVTEVMKLCVSYSQITSEEEGLWNIDVNIFLSEETAVTANYTSRTACGDLVMKLGEWLPGPAVDGLLAYTGSLYSTNQIWKAKEAALYILDQILADYQDTEKHITPEAANGFIDFVRHAMQQGEEFLRARGYLVAGRLIRTSGDALSSVAASFMQATMQAITSDASEVVKVSAIRALQFYLEAPALPAAQPAQGDVINALSAYISTQDMGELTESEDLIATLVQTIRDALLLNPGVCLTGNGLDLLFTVANFGASKFMVSQLVSETFDDVTETIASGGPEPYAQLCSKVLPSLTGAFHISALTEENALTSLAANLLSTLTKFGSEPLPPGFVAAVMPKLNRILLESNDEELLNSATLAVKNMLSHDHKQMFEWHDESGKGGLEAVLVIIDRLLGPTVEENAGAEVGGLAAELVEKAGSDRLGPFLMQLLSAVAIRLSTASRAQFIQSLILVFARLSLVSAREVVDFLAQVQVGPENGLQVVIAKWLENSVNFAGYDEIRQK
jgi:hypothetical protein